MTLDNREVHVGPIYGVRKWSLRVSSGFRGNVRLEAMSQGYTWRPGWNHAKVQNTPYAGWGSGLYALTSTRRLRLLGGSNERFGSLAVGVMEMHGKVAVHQAGYRAQWARPVAIGYRGELAQSEQLALARWCQYHDIVYLARCRSYGPFGKLARTYRQFRRGKLHRKLEAIPELNHNYRQDHRW